MTNFKVFQTHSKLKAAIKRKSLHLFNYEIENHCSSVGTGLIPVFWVHDVEDLNEVNSRGFHAKINPSKAAG